MTELVNMLGQNAKTTIWRKENPPVNSFRRDLHARYTYKIGRRPGRPSQCSWNDRGESLSCFLFPTFFFSILAIRELIIEYAELRRKERVRILGFLYSCKPFSSYRQFLLIARFPTIPNQFWEFCLLATCIDF